MTIETLIEGLYEIQDTLDELAREANLAKQQLESIEDDLKVQRDDLQYFIRQVEKLEVIE